MIRVLLAQLNEALHWYCKDGRTYPLRCYAMASRDCNLSTLISLLTDIRSIHPPPGTQLRMARRS